MTPTWSRLSKLLALLGLSGVAGVTLWNLAPVAPTVSPTTVAAPTPTVTAPAVVAPESRRAARSGATADGVNDAGACDSDAQRLCPTEWGGGSVQASWKLDLVECLYEDHLDQLSAACRASLERRQALNAALNSACAADRGRFCVGVHPAPGSEPGVDCLRDHRAELEAACAAALAAHEGAKPVDAR